MNDFLTWETLATIGGASVIVTCLTQLLKRKLCLIPTQIVSYIFALIIMILASFITGLIASWQDFLLTALNALVVSLAANGEYGAVKRFVGENKK